ncbi:MAG: hypothetical protein IPM81_19005 [Saprospirales bacterium]|nr:hypothetical protein [Saprospirales bacterium]
MIRVPIFLLAFQLCWPSGHAQKVITLDDCFTFFKFYPQTADQYRFGPDGRHYHQAERKAVSLNMGWRPAGSRVRW